ncbi:MAG: site-specific integrase, partial [Ginsengibacter sp.]
MEAVILKPVLHRGEECIGIYFEKNAIIQNLIQKYAGAKWSRTHKCWYVSLSKNNYEVIAKALNGKVQLRTDELKKHLLLKRDNSTPIQKGIDRTIEKLKLPKQTESISKENELEFIQYKNRLILKGYSPSTIRTYCNEFQIFLHTLKNKSAKELSPAQLQRYILYCINQLKLSENTVHSRMNALKFYYEQVLKNEKMFFEIP